MLEGMVQSDWFNQTTLHPLGLVTIGLLGLCMQILPRRFAMIPFIILVCFMSPAQRIVALTLDFTLIRVIVLFGWLRIVLRGEGRDFTWQTLDKIVLLWAFSGTVAMVLLHGSVSVFIYRLGLMFDAAGMYFLFRILIRDWKDIEIIATSVVVISIPLAGAFLLEKYTGRNVFSIFGGVPEYSLVRNGVLRCQGAFAHPILAGSFWAALMPIIGALWFHRDWRRILALIGIITSLTIIWTCGSTTPLAAVVLGVMVVLLYPFRRHLNWFRWGGVVGLLLLHIAMTSPVWHLLSRIELTKGSNGWYRYKLIDDFIRHFPEWWLVGTKSTSHWWEWGSNDVTNQYVLEGVTGGLLTLVLFIMSIVFAFRSIGRFEEQVGSSHTKRAMAWALGVSLFIHCVIFIGVSYFGQSMMLWYLMLAMIGSLTSLHAIHSPRAVLQARDVQTGRLKRLAIRVTQGSPHVSGHDALDQSSAQG